MSSAGKQHGNPVRTDLPDPVARPVGDVHGSVSRDREAADRVREELAGLVSGRWQLRDREHQAGVDGPHLQVLVLVGENEHASLDIHRDVAWKAKLHGRGYGAFGERQCSPARDSLDVVSGSVHKSHPAVAVVGDVEAVRRNSDIARQRERCIDRQAAIAAAAPGGEVLGAWVCAGDRDDRWALQRYHLEHDHRLHDHQHHC